LVAAAGSLDLRHARDRAAAGLYPDRRSARLSRRLRRLLPQALFRLRQAVLPKPLHRAADLEPPVVRRVPLGLHHGAWRGGAGSRTGAHRVYRARACAAVLGLRIAGGAVAALRSLSAVPAAKLSVNACAVRRLVQSRAVRDGVLDRLPAGPFSCILA